MTSILVRGGRKDRKFQFFAFLGLTFNSFDRFLNFFNFFIPEGQNMSNDPKDETYKKQ